MTGASSLPKSVPVAVLLGGGVESTLLVTQFLQAGYRVVPVHLTCGLIWDEAELAFVRRFCARRAQPRLDPLVEIQISLREYLGDHWAVTGKQVPRAGEVSARLEIPLRNLTLLGFAVRRLDHLEDFAMALGTTADNRFPDGSREYFDRCEAVFTLERSRPLQILTPLIRLTKTQVIQHSDQESLAASFSCVHPRGGRHCGTCIKCGSRRSAFLAAGVPDPTDYVGLNS